MRADAAAADRAYEVRCAARAWRSAGLIDEAALGAVEAIWPDDRVRARPVFRILLASFNAFSVLAALGVLLFALRLSEDTSLLVLALFGLGLAVATEIQTGPMKRAGGGTEEATSLLAVLFLSAFSWGFAHRAFSWSFSECLLAFCASSALLLTAACMRWGYAPYAAIAAVALLHVLARSPHGRLLWLIVGIAAAPILLRASESARLAPSHRRACAWALVVAIGAVYGATQLYSWDQHFVEAFGDRATLESAIDHGTVTYLPADPGDGGTAGRLVPIYRPPGLLWRLARILCALATGAIPLLVLGFGIRTRRRLLVDSGAVLTAISLMTIRVYLHLAATWLVLALAGGLVIVLALWLRRWLEAGPRRERAGFTAESLFESASRQRVFEVAAAVVAFSPQARAAAPPKEPGFVAKGGASGGGGAGGEF